MDLRSSRSRSKTPFVRSSIEEELQNTENHIGQTFIRTTRSTVTKTINSSDIDNVADFHTSESYRSKPIKTRSSKSEKYLKKSRHKTSDYSSSEDSEQLSPSHSVNQNINNEFIEEIRRSVSRSSGVSALEVYRAAGDYWNKFPKTDYTYSPHSKDRTEIAPGIIAMPNMSRRSLHDYALRDNQTNTEVYEKEEVDHSLISNYNSKLTSTYSENLTSIKPSTLFSNNSYKDKYTYRSSTASSIKRKTVYQKIVSIVSSTIVTIFTFISIPFYYMYNTQNSGFAWVGKRIHRMTTKLMLWDTWLLRSDQKKKKLSTVLALCLIPLLILGGWWFLSGLGPLLYGAFLDSTSTILSTLTSLSNNNKKTGIDFNYQNEEHDNLIRELHNDHFTNRKVEDKIITIKERIIQEPSTANEIAVELTSNQLEEITNMIENKLNLENSHNTDAIIEKILQSSTIKDIFNNYNNLNIKLNQNFNENDREVVDEAILRNQQLIIEQLQDEIRKVRAELINLEQARNDDISNLINQMRSENIKNNAKLMYQLNRCCRSSIVHMESYIMRLLKDILGAPHYLSTQNDIHNWLHSAFIAREDLESRLTNLTRHLKSDYNALIENNGKILMEKIMSSISVQLNKQIEKALKSTPSQDMKELKLDSLTDEHIKKIVTNALSIYDADKTGLVDYALESAGGQILSTRCTESYQARTAVLSILGIPLWYPTNTPRTVISPGMTPGECWAFQNFPGFLLVKLAAPIKIEAFSLEHISKMLVTNGKIDSAPKEFSVYGLRNESDKEPLLIGQYTYEYDGPPLQYFAAVHYGLIFDIIELRILSNHGNPNYTCLYRFRVHGTLSIEPT